MRIKPGFTLRTIGNEHIIIADSAENVDFSRIISLNESAARLWTAIGDKEFTAENSAAKLREWYEVDEATARDDAQRLIDAWKEVGLIEE